MLPILIVDDEPSIAQLIAMTLEPLGQPLIIAHDGEMCIRDRSSGKAISVCIFAPCGFAAGRFLCAKKGTFS